MPAYQLAVVTFLDIMGFSTIVTDRTAAENDRMLDAVSSAAAKSDVIVGAGDNKTDILSFSDSVIRARPYGGGIRESTLIHELEDLAAAQWQLTAEGILIRGGMTTGPISISRNRAFGPAFVRAYDLETRFANVPRILLDPVLISELRKNEDIRPQNRTLRSEIRKVRRLVRQGDDGLWFVDYLAAMFGEFDDPDDHLAGMLAHRNMILQGAVGLELTDPLLPKYLWLSRYHNAVSERFHPGRREIRIRRSDLRSYDELLLPKLVLSSSKQKRS